MSNRSYCTVKDIKDTLGISSTTDDILIRKIIEGATISIEKYADRKFQVEYATKYFEGANRLWVTPDLLTVSTMKTDDDGDGTFENTFTTSDYVLMPFNEFPKTCVEISDNSNYTTFAKGSKKGVEIVGFWGYGESSSPYIADTIITEALTSGETAVDISSTVNLAVGQTWLIDAEQYYVTDVSASTASVICAVNGTSKASHTASTVIYIYEYPADIRQACIDLSVALYQNRGRQGLQSERLGDYSFTIAGTSLGKGTVEALLDDKIRSYKRMKV